MAHTSSYSNKESFGSGFSPLSKTFRCVDASDHRIQEACQSLGFSYFEVSSLISSATGTQKISGRGVRSYAEDPAQAGKLILAYTHQYDEKDTLFVTLSSYKSGGQSQSFFLVRNSQSTSYKSPVKKYQPKKLAPVTVKQPGHKHQWFVDSVLGSASSNVSLHPYLVGKKVTGEGSDLRCSEYRGRNQLLIPYRDLKGNVLKVQIIAQNEDSKFAKIYFPGGDHQTPSWVTVGDISKSQVVYLCEGIADGLTIFQSTGYACIVAGSVNRLPLVYNAIKHLHDDIRNASDDDFTTQQKDATKANAGILNAINMREVYGVSSRLPTTKDQKYKDFSDLYLAEGSNALKRILDPEKMPKKACLSIGRSRLDKSSIRLTYSAKESNYGLNGALSNFIRSFLGSGSSSQEECFNHVKHLSKAYTKDEFERKFFYILGLENNRLKKATQISFPVGNIYPTKIDVIPQFSQQGKQTHWQMTAESLNKILSSKAKIICLNLPMGLGKTEHIIKKAIDQSASSAMIVQRTLLASENSRRLGIPSYLDAEKFELESLDKFIISIQSLISAKTGFGNGMIDKDLVVVDEFTRVLSEFDSSTIEAKSKTPTLETFVESLGSAKKLILSDADFNNQSINFVREHFPNEEIEIFMAPDAKPIDRQIKLGPYEKIISQTKELLGGMNETPDFSKRFRVCTDTLSTCSIFEEIFSEVNMSKYLLVINSRTRELPEVKEWINNPNEMSQKYLAVVHTSSIECGVSITKPVFHSTLGIFTAGTLEPQVATQMAMRDRVCSNVCFGFGKNYERSIYDKNSEREVQSLHAKANEAGLNIDIGPLDRLITGLRSNKSLSRQNYNLSLSLHLQNLGFKVCNFHMDENERKKTRKMCAEIVAKIKEEELDDTLKAQLISKEEASKLISKGFRNREEQISLDKYMIVNHFALKDVGLCDVEFYKKHGLAPIHSYHTLVHPKETVVEFDQLEHQLSTTPILRKFLFAKWKILRLLFHHTKVDIFSGEGEYTKKECDAFVQAIRLRTNLAKAFDYYKLGTAIPIEHVKDSTKLVNTIFEKAFGFSVESRKDSKGYLHYSLEQDTFEYVRDICERRESKNLTSVNVDELKERLRLREHLSSSYEHSASPVADDFALEFLDKDPPWDREELPF